MDRVEAAAKIASAELSWGYQRDMFLYDKRGRELARQAAYDRLFNWALSLPESTFRERARHHAPSYVNETEES